MGLREDAQELLCGYAETAWDNYPHEDGYAIISEPLTLNSVLKSLEVAKDGDESVEFRDQLESLLLDSYSIVRLIWNASGPGLGTVWGVGALGLSSGRRLYVESSDWLDGPRILSVSDKTWMPRMDRKFLQLLFKSNGSAFGTGVVGSPPNYVGTSINSFPFLIDLFVAAFDCAGEECWESLVDGWDVWNEAYENPDDPMEIPDELLARARQEDIGNQGARGLTSVTAMSHESRAREIASKILLRDEIDEFINEHRFRKRTPLEPEAKVQIVSRYLGIALNDSGLGVALSAPKTQRTAQTSASLIAMAVNSAQGAGEDVSEESGVLRDPHSELGRGATGP